MICLKCGKEIFPGEKFCGNCGNPIDSVPVTGNVNKPVEKVNNVVEEIKPVVETPVSTEPPVNVSGIQVTPKKKSKVWIILLILLIIAAFFVVTVVAGGIILYKMGVFGGSSSVNTSTYAYDAAYIGSEIAGNVSEPMDDAGYNEIDSYQVSNIISQNSNYTDFGIYVCNLDNGYEFSYYADTEFLASAMCQVVILDTVGRVIEEENLDLDYEELYFSYIANGKESPSSKNDDGEFVSIKKCIEDVAIYGDNNKSNHLVDYIGIASTGNYEDGFNIINEKLRNNGYYSTEINRKIYVDTRFIDESASPNVTTARDISEIFENLVKHSTLGSESYMRNIFKSVSNDGTAIGIKKFVPTYYDICSVNAYNSQSTNDVALISDGDTEILVAILSHTDENRTDEEGFAVREKVQEKLIAYIMETQFGY